MQESILQTPLGSTKIIGNKDGVCAISVLDVFTETTINIPTELQEATNQLHEYFEKKRKIFTFKTNAKGTNFQHTVWKELQNIPYGKTISYQELAIRLGNKKVIRAAASANGKNPLWIVVPCHRVIGANGDLIGYAGGVWRKKWLLEHENSLQQLELF